MEIIKIKKKQDNVDINFRKINVAAYVRVSTKEEMQRHSYESMFNYYENKITKNANWNLVKIYGDEGISGRNTDKRKGFNEMIQDALDGKIDLILTKSISRFGRNSVDVISTVRQLKEKNVGVKFEEENIFTLEMESEMLISVLSSVAQKESEEISKRNRISFVMHNMNGDLILSSAPFGYILEPGSGKYIINEYEAAIVRKIYRLYINGTIITDIIRYLNANNLKTKQNCDFHRATVRRILTNVAYVGDIEKGRYYTDELTKRKRLNTGSRPIFLFKNAHEPIISREDFERVQDILKGKKDKFNLSKKNQSESKSWNIPGFYRCGFCGSRIALKRVQSKYIDGGYRMFRCRSGEYNKGDLAAKCDFSVTIREEIIKNAFLELQRRLDEFNYKEYKNEQIFTKEFKKINSKKELYEKELTQNADLFLNKQIGLDEYNIKKSNIESELEPIIKEINKLEENEESYKILDKIQLRFKECKNIRKFDFDFYREFIKYVILGGRISSRPYGTLIRFVFNGSNIKNRMNISKEEIIDNSPDSSKNKLVELMKIHYPVQFSVHQYNPAIDRREVKKYDHVIVTFEYEKEI